jgi:hypothetical protein
MKNSPTNSHILFGMSHRHVKPKGLAETTILMAVCDPLSFLFLKPARGDVGVQVFVTALSVAVSYLVLWCYWRGRNWARIFVLLDSVITMLNLLAFPSASAVQRVVLILEALLAGFLLVWLNRRPAREFFKRGAVPVDSQQAAAPNGGRHCAPAIREPVAGRHR